MYAVAVRRDFVAQHYLVGGDFGAENQRHSHHYRIELSLAGQTLDRLGYLVDIVEIERSLDEMVARYRDRTLNELPEFGGSNPSIERFADILTRAFSEQIREPRVTSLTVTLWENEIAWASCRVDRQGEAP
jgi:6-pyruvoyltetrahydropterin/6-carboxytetrahydropterin synthase